MKDYIFVKLQSAKFHKECSKEKGRTL